MATEGEGKGDGGNGSQTHTCCVGDSHWPLVPLGYNSGFFLHLLKSVSLLVIMDVHYFAPYCWEISFPLSMISPFPFWSLTSFNMLFLFLFSVFSLEVWKEHCNFYICSWPLIPPDFLNLKVFLGCGFRIFLLCIWSSYGDFDIYFDLIISFLLLSNQLL